MRMFNMNYDITTQRHARKESLPKSPFLPQIGLWTALNSHLDIHFPSSTLAVINQLSLNVHPAPVSNPLRVVGGQCPWLLIASIDPVLKLYSGVITKGNWSAESKAWTHKRGTRIKEIGLKWRVQFQVIVYLCPAPSGCCWPLPRVSIGQRVSNAAQCPPTIRFISVMRNCVLLSHNFNDQRN